MDSYKSKIRTMTENDLKQVLRWRNDPFVRKNMFSNKEIPFREHQDWYKKCSSDPNHYLLIFENFGEPSGFVNFKVKIPSMEASWGFYRSPSSFSGVGVQMGNAALLYAFKKLNVKKIWGEVLMQNKRSIDFHLSMGFKEETRLENDTESSEVSYNIVCFSISKHDFKPLKMSV